MKRHGSIKLLESSGRFGVGAALSAQDRLAVKSPNGIAFSEFKGYESWPVIAPQSARRSRRMRRVEGRLHQSDRRQRRR